MKEIRPKEDKAVSPIIATILLIAITVVLAATLVTILGGFTHGVSNTVETAGVTSHVVSISKTSGIIYINVSSSSSAISSSSVTITLSGASFTHPSSTNTLASVMASNPGSFTGGADYKVPISLSGSQTVAGVSFELIYKGNVIYNSAA
jgi:flagellin-like protein